MSAIFTENWKQYLERQFLKNDRCKRRAYICSPLSAETDSDFVHNMHAARAYMYYAFERMGMYARAPHAYLPMLLCDKLPSERALGLSFGLSLLENSDLILVFGNRLSNGMKGEIVYAASFQMPMIVFDEGLYREVQKEITRRGGDKRSVRLDRQNEMMSLPSPISYMEKTTLLE